MDDILERLKAIRNERESLEKEITDIRETIINLQLELENMDEIANEAEEEQSDAQASHKQQLFRCMRLFNDSAKKGVAALKECNAIDGSALSIAKFLFETERLNKTQIGEYLGENDPLNLEVLRLFASLHDFTGMTFDAALRQYLWSFKLPGEAQKIDRMMESFAVRFVECNPRLFGSKDSCYVLAFSIIMLNTSLHNPSVKNKPTLESFISMNRGLDNGADFPPELLSSLYDSIKRTPFKLPGDESGDALTFINPERNGWLVKQGGGHKTWHRRWFTLCNNCLYYFARESDTKPKGHIPLENLEVRALPGSKFIFEIYFEGENENDKIKAAKMKDGKMTQGRHSSYRIQADTQADMDEWIKCIRAAMTKNPFYQLYCKRKELVNTSSSC